jgi:DNA-binding protein H-NS
MAKNPHPIEDLSWIENLTFDELTALAVASTAARDAKKAQAQAELLAEFRERAIALGFDPSFATQKKATRLTGKGVSTLPPKYRNPATGETFSGKGRGNPEWLDKGNQDHINPDWQAATGKLK